MKLEPTQNTPIHIMVSISCCVLFTKSANSIELIHRKLVKFVFNTIELQRLKIMSNFMTAWFSQAHLLYVLVELLLFVFHIIIYVKHKVFTLVKC